MAGERCQRCGWPYEAMKGCTPGNCSCRCDAFPHCVCGRRIRRVSTPTDPRDAEIERLRGALRQIAAPHDCGCNPCRGQCRSQEALAITVDELRDAARAALKEGDGG